LLLRWTVLPPGPRSSGISDIKAMISPEPEPLDTVGGAGRPDGVTDEALTGQAMRWAWLPVCAGEPRTVKERTGQEC